ncbi:sarcosine oxidase subunit gamma [Allobranchiibius sp. CTAmp26]|uniref:sarcosine oxidase subunit gamma n=1 Tax=Allobranchiibius sp. CTAmp26 TaxID=2815214 RepID=UPI001AA19C92|nr:sarcosine oxidase subunit gamma family protein [Allobranchiibius sp. CTAmp26]MBO1754554.1 sarcosine oxidase subunit gamma [Allobranchiibius sp. CTAmp26]
MVDRSSVLERRRSPLHALTEELEHGSGAGVQLHEVPFLAQIGLRVRPGSPSAAALEAALAGPLPAGVGQVTALPAGRSTLWLGPDEYLVLAPDERDGGLDPAALTAELVTALGELPGQVVDLSANRTTLELSGPHAQDVLDKSCRLDLDPQAFPVGHAVATLLESVGVIVWRTDVGTWRVMPRASFAVHVARWLLDGMREYR